MREKKKKKKKKQKKQRVFEMGSIEKERATQNQRETEHSNDIT
jgi:hypothetical protein